MKQLKIMKVGIDRYRIIEGVSSVEGAWNVTGRIVQEVVDEALAENTGDVVNFELIGSFPDRDLSQVVHELNCVLKARENLYLLHRAGRPKQEVREAFDNFVTAATTMNFFKLMRCLGLEKDEDDQAA